MFALWTCVVSCYKVVPVILPNPGVSCCDLRANLCRRPIDLHFCFTPEPICRARNEILVHLNRSMTTEYSSLESTLLQYIGLLDSNCVIIVSKKYYLGVQKRFKWIQSRFAFRFDQKETRSPLMLIGNHHHASVSISVRICLYIFIIQNETTGTLSSHSKQKAVL
jgi:hypothetical protein